MRPWRFGTDGVGAGETDREVRDVRPRGPDLLAVEDPLLAVAHRAGGERRQIRSRARLAEELAPLLRGCDDRRQEPQPLLLGAVREERGRGAVEPERVEPAEVVRRELGLGGTGLRRRQVEAAVRHRPRRPPRARSPRSAGTSPRSRPGCAPPGSRHGHPPPRPATPPAPSPRPSRARHGSPPPPAWCDRG